MTARTVARHREKGNDFLNGLTAENVRKVTRFRSGGIEALEEAIQALKIQDKKPAFGEVEDVAAEK